MKCPKCGYENKDDTLCCSLCGKVFRKEKIEIEKKEEKKKSPKSPREPESDEDFLDHDDGFWGTGFDYRNVIYAFKKLRKRILHPIEVCLFAVFCGGFFQMVFCFLDEWGIIPGLKSFTGKKISVAFSFIIPVIILAVFFMKKTTKNILLLCEISILAIIIISGTVIFENITGWKGVPQLPSPHFLLILLLIIFISGIVYKILRRKNK